MKKVLAIVLSAVVLATTAITFAACSSGSAAQKGAVHAVASQTAAPTEYKAPAESATPVKTAAAAQTADVNDNTDQDDSYRDQYVTNDDYNDDSNYGSSEEYTNYRSNSEIYRKLYHTIQDSGASGYAICSVYGIDGQALLLSYGDVEANRYYEIYQILGDELNYIGQLSGAHTVAFIGNDGMLGIYNAHMGYYTFGPVLYNEGDLDALCNQEGVVSSGESYPDIPGSEISFFGTDNITGIAQF